MNQCRTTPHQSTYCRSRTLASRSAPRHRPTACFSLRAVGWISGVLKPLVAARGLQQVFSRRMRQFAHAEVVSTAPRQSGSTRGYKDAKPGVQSITNAATGAALCGGQPWQELQRILPIDAAQFRRAESAERRIRRGTCRSVPELENAVLDYVRTRNRNPKPLTWTRNPPTIIRKVRRITLLTRETGN